MSVSFLGSRSTRLFILLTAFFVGNAVVAEFVGVKIFALEKTLGLPPFGWNLFGQQGSLSFTAGVLIWPIVFILTDVINEYFGRRGVRLDLVRRDRDDLVRLPVRVRLHPPGARRLLGHGQRGARRARHAGRLRATSSARACGRSAVRSPRSSSAR